MRGQDTSKDLFATASDFVVFSREDRNDKAGGGDHEYSLVPEPDSGGKFNPAQLSQPPLVAETPPGILQPHAISECGFAGVRFQVSDRRLPSDRAFDPRRRYNLASAPLPLVEIHGSETGEIPGARPEA